MIGIDKHIETLKDMFTSKLYTSFDYTSYGRAFMNDRDEKVIPEVLDSDNEYKEVLLDDNLAGLSFFVVDSEYVSDNPTLLNSKVYIYFAVNLSTLYSTVTERAVEYVHKDVITLINNTVFNLTGITTGKDVFSEFDINIGDNMQPFYLVKFSTEVEWNINQC